MRKCMQAAGFPYAATLEQFDFSIRPELRRPVMLRYFDSSFVEKAGSLVLVGPSGLGKTHLAIALGTRMVQLGYSERFVTAQYVANTVLAAQTRVERAGVVQPLIKCQVLIVDEFGYLPLERAYWQERIRHMVTEQTHSRQKLALLQRQGGKCEMCGLLFERTEEMDIHLIRSYERFIDCKLRFG